MNEADATALVGLTAWCDKNTLAGGGMSARWFLGDMMKHGVRLAAFHQLPGPGDGVC